jgi:hypothetical protein
MAGSYSLAHAPRHAWAKIPITLSLRAQAIRIVDSYASLLVLLLANFFLLELVDDPRWGAIGSRTRRCSERCARTY